MKTIECILGKIAESSKISSKNCILNNNDLINYFNWIVNENKFIHVPKYDLEISTINEDYQDKLYYFDQHNHKIIINKNMLINEFLKKYNIDYNYELNIYLLETINSIIAEIEIYRMLEDNITYKIEPYFYMHLVEEFLPKNKKYLINHYIETRKKYITSYLLSLSLDYGLIPTKKLEYDINCNNYILSIFLNSDENIPLIKSIINNYDKYYPLTSNFIKEKLGANISYRYSIASRQTCNSDNLLNKILLGKPISDKEELLDIQSTNSIFEYAEKQNKQNTNSLIKKILNK